LKLASLIVIAFGFAGCSSGSSSPSVEFVPPPVSFASPGGLWVGVDSDGQDVSAIVSEDSFFYFLDGRFETGSGILTVINGKSVLGSFLPPPEPGFVSQDENLNRSCKLSGSIVERDFMTLDVQCRTEANQQVITTLDFNYDTRYERDSSLAVIAGDYGYSAGMVLSIDAIGSIFGQDALNGRVINGQITLINSDFNLYGIAWNDVCCIESNSALRSESFFGLALLDNTVVPEQLVIAVSRTRDSGNAVLSIISFIERL